MDYPRIIRRVYQEPWCILPSMHETIQSVVENHMQGHSAPITLASRKNHFNAAALSFEPPRTRGSRVYRRGQLAYIPVEGIIGKNMSLMETLCGGYDINQLGVDAEEAMTDPTVKNVLFDFNSPGGQITGVPEAAAMLRELSGQKRTFAITDTMSASASYWLMSQLSSIYVTASATAGSVGVYVYRLDRTKQLEAQGITPVLIKAGKFKAMGLPGNPLSEEEIQMLQTQVDMIYNMMKSDITKMRTKVDDSTLQGQIFLGKQIVEAKLADAMVKNLGSLVERLS